MSRATSIKSHCRVGAGRRPEGQLSGRKAQGAARQACQRAPGGVIPHRFANLPGSELLCEAVADVLGADRLAVGLLPVLQDALTSPEGDVGAVELSGHRRGRGRAGSTQHQCHGHQQPVPDHHRPEAADTCYGPEQAGELDARFVSSWRWLNQINTSIVYITDLNYVMDV